MEPNPRRSPLGSGLDDRAGHPEAGRPGTDGPSSGPWRVLLGLAAMVSGLALIWLFLPAAGSSTGARPASRRAPSAEGLPSVQAIPRTGVLLYAADPEGRGRQVLWTLDLVSGGALPGPVIPRVTSISDASLAAKGWVGLTVREGDGVRVLVLHGTGVADRPRLLGRGDLAVWAPRGDVVAVARRGDRPQGCREARIDVIHVATDTVERALRLPHGCGDLLSLGRDINTTYFASRSGTAGTIPSVGIYSVGIDLAHPVLLGYTLQGVSPTADFLVNPEHGTGGSRGTRLFWPGTGGPIPYGHADRPLVVRRVLAWSQDGSRAAVLGRAGPQRGIFLLDTSAGPDPRRLPLFVGAVGRRTFATFARDGTLYLAVDGVLVRYVDGEARAVPLPEGAPPPSGPILWLP